MDATSNENHEKSGHIPKGTLGPTEEQKTCLEILNLVLDDEASPEQREYFKKHLQHCMPYYEIFSVDKLIKEMVKNKCNCHPVPEDLVDSIKSKISDHTP